MLESGFFPYLAKVSEKAQISFLNILETENTCSTFLRHYKVIQETSTQGIIIDSNLHHQYGVFPNLQENRAAMETQVVMGNGRLTTKKTVKTIMA